jgi:hypothetical protein
VNVGPAFSGTIGTVGRSVALRGGRTMVPSGASQVLVRVTIHGATAAGELLIAGSREGQVGFSRGADTTVLLPITLVGSTASLHLSTGKATVTLDEVGYYG